MPIAANNTNTASSCAASGSRRHDENRERAAVLVNRSSREPELRVAHFCPLTLAAHDERRVDRDQHDHQHAIGEQAVEHGRKARSEGQQDYGERAEDSDADSENRCRVRPRPLAADCEPRATPRAEADDAAACYFAGSGAERSLRRSARRPYSAKMIARAMIIDLS